MRYFLLLLLALSFGAMADTGPTLWVNGGHSTLSGVANQVGSAYSIEETLPTDGYGTYEIGYLSEGHIDMASRSGLVFKMRFDSHLTDVISPFMTLGVYLSDSTLYIPNSPLRIDGYNGSAIVGLGIRAKITKSWAAQARWEHVQFSDKYLPYNSDILMFGVGYSN